MKTVVVGAAFNPEMNNLSENISEYVSQLEYYRPRGFGKIRDEMRKLLNKPEDHEDWEYAWEMMQDADELLSDFARRQLGHDYVQHGPFEHGGAVGFYYNVDCALEDADLKIDSGDEVPKGFTGLLAEVTDHGNVTVSRWFKGRRGRELFAVV